MFPHPVYAGKVLARNFRDFQRLFLDSLADVLTAHALMLGRSGLLPPADERAVLAALAQLDLEAIRAREYDGSTEDVFFFVDRELERLAGEAAGRLRVARSRNDMDATLYRMRLREALLALGGELLGLHGVLLRIAGEHMRTVYPAHTHTQPAQPTTLAHLLLGVSECLLRDAQRVRQAWTTVNCSPMGACAITTTGFPIDRRETMRLLGFEQLQMNSYGAIAAVDYLAEALSACSTAMLTLGQFLQQLLDWSRPEHGFLISGDAWVQISSIMPQKRNPVAFEHARILASRALAGAQAAVLCLHNVPFEDTVDREDDLMPAVFQAFEDASSALAVVRGALADARFDRERMRDLARRRFITATELADTLVRREGLSFRLAHELVSRAVRSAAGDEPAALAAAVEQEAVRLLGRPPGLSAEELEEALDSLRFIAIRRVEGGPAPEAVQAQAAAQQSAAEEFRRWLEQRDGTLSGARRRLREARESACHAA